MPGHMKETEKGVFQYTVESFDDAHQNSYDSASPGQDPSSFDLLTNVMPVTRGSIDRRWGYGLFNNPSFSARRFYEYQNDSTNVRELVLTSSSAVKAITEAGVAFNTGVFSPGAGAGHPRMVNSRNYAFFVDGVAADLKKWDGSSSAGTSNWGIASPAGVSTATAATSCGTGANVTTTGLAWTNPGNITAADAAFATHANLNSGTDATDGLKGTNYGFAIPSDATIVGIKVEIKAKYS